MPLSKYFGFQNPFDAYITALDNNKPGGVWVSFPTTAESLQDVFQRLELTKDDWAIPNMDCHVNGVRGELMECNSLDELNYLAAKLEDLTEEEFEQFQAVVEINEHCDDVADLINLCDNLDCYNFTMDVTDEEDLARQRLSDRNTFDQHTVDALYNYIDFEDFGEDIASEENGKFSDNCYIVPSGSTFVEYYSGEIQDIPEQYRVTTLLEVPGLTEEERLDKSIELAIDLDNFFRHHDADYAARCPNDQQQKEAISDDLFAGKIAAIEKRLEDMGLDRDDDLFMELNAYKAAIRYDPEQDKLPMKVLMVEPGKVPYAKEIEPGLKSLQEQVGGFIEAVYPYDDLVALICNEEGKLLGMELNRALRDDDGKVYDIMAGPFMVVGVGEEDFASLTDDLLQKYEEKFKHPEVFLQMGNRFIVCKQPISEADNRRPIQEQLKEARQKCAERPVTGIKKTEPER